MRRRAADLAVLRAIGSSSRNLVATLRWQALVLTGASILIGVPLGLIASRVGWALFSRSLGIAPGTVTPLLTPALAAIGLPRAGLDTGDTRRTARPEHRSAAPVQRPIATGQEDR
jgi:predicted lysophospholipase L1 biosynthesis ABC-type transport system permease subunit